MSEIRRHHHHHNHNRSASSSSILVMVPATPPRRGGGAGGPPMRRSHLTPTSTPFVLSTPTKNGNNNNNATTGSATIAGKETTIAITPSSVSRRPSSHRRCHSVAGLATTGGHIRRRICYGQQQPSRPQPIGSASRSSSANSIISSNSINPTGNNNSNNDSSSTTKTTTTTSAMDDILVVGGSGSVVGEQHHHDDRFIPSRGRMNLDLCRRTLLSATTGIGASGKSTDKKKRPRQEDSNSSGDSSNDGNGQQDGDESQQPASLETSLQKEYKRRMLSSLCNIPLDKLDEDCEPKGILSFGGSSSKSSSSSCKQKVMGGNGLSSTSSSSSSGRKFGNPFGLDSLRTMKLGCDVTGSEDSEYDSIANMQEVVNKVTTRKVSCAPVRILDAPDIVDDYYLNLISWSKDNILAVALARSVYFWNATTGDINTLITVDSGNDYITSVSWCPIHGQTKYIAVGTNSNVIHIMDGETLQKVRTLTGHTSRVSSLCWNYGKSGSSNSNQGCMLTSGGRDSRILNHDVRTPQHIVSRYSAHLQEVCGLKWNDDGTCLASGGNENYLCLWDIAMSNGRGRDQHQRGQQQHRFRQTQTPRLILKQHKAAVKAIDWCPYHRGLLASGGGTADRTIKFWNTTSGTVLNSIDTGSQVCSIIWSKTQPREICSSHGFSENQLILWKYPTMTKIAELTGHTSRVLNMDISPDGCNIVSAGADETLRFWNVFETTLGLNGSSTRHNGVRGYHTGSGVGPSSNVIGAGGLSLSGGPVIR